MKCRQNDTLPFRAFFAQADESAVFPHAPYQKQIVARGIKLTRAIRGASASIQAVAELALKP